MKHLKRFNESKEEVTGKLILILPKDYGNGSWYGKTIIDIKGKEYHPILIDESNPIKTGDEYIYFGGFGFSKDNFSIRTCASKENERTANSGRDKGGNSGWKVLAMPDDFPTDVDNKIKNMEIKDLEAISFTKKVGRQKYS